MSDSKKEVHKALTDQLFRHSYSKMVAVLVRYFGLKQLEIAEDIVQDTLVAAMEQWGNDSIPRNPEGWLMDVAKKKTINYLKRQQNFNNTIRPRLVSGQGDMTEPDISKDAISDSMLRMIFSCCHPRLPEASQIALALKTLCGFSIPEIANALLTTEANINKRLYRAKQQFRKGSIAYEIPNAETPSERLETVLKVLYLLFNEGYYSQHNEKIIRIEMCYEAIRLLKIIAEAYPSFNKTMGLLALMYLQIARIESRLDEQGILILLEEQQRNLWNTELIHLGSACLTSSTASHTIDPYQLQAGIALEHAVAKDFAHTNWTSIHQQYTLLAKIDGNPTIRLNKAVAQFYAGEQDAAIAAILALKDTKLHTNALYYATLGKLYTLLHENKKALPYFKKALLHSKSKAEQLRIEQFIQSL